MIREDVNFFNFLNQLVIHNLRIQKASCCILADRFQKQRPWEATANTAQGEK